MKTVCTFINALNRKGDMIFFLMKKFFIYQNELNSSREKIDYQDVFSIPK